MRARFTSLTLAGSASSTSSSQLPFRSQIGIRPALANTELVWGKTLTTANMVTSANKTEIMLFLPVSNPAAPWPPRGDEGPTTAASVAAPLTEPRPPPPPRPRRLFGWVFKWLEETEECGFECPDAGWDAARLAAAPWDGGAFDGMVVDRRTTATGPAQCAENCPVHGPARAAQISNK